MQGNEVADLCIFIFCVVILVAYNLIYFTEAFRKKKFRFRGAEYQNLWGIGLEARAVWAVAIMEDPKEGILAAQTVRNMVMGVSITGAAVTLLAAQLILIVTDPVKLKQISYYEQNDPITQGASFMSPEIKVGISLVLLFACMLAMVQCIRLSVHLGYILRAVPNLHKSKHRKFHHVAMAINRRASLFFAIGLRLLFVFFPLFMYVLGALALLLTTVIEIIALFLMDLTPVTPDELDDVTMDGGTTTDAGEGSSYQFDTLQMLQSTASGKGRGLVAFPHSVPPSRQASVTAVDIGGGIQRRVVQQQQPPNNNTSDLQEYAALVD